MLVACNKHPWVSTSSPAEPSCTIDAAITALKAAQIIAYPTEAMFGLGCDPRNLGAVTKLLALKQRSWRKGTILVAAHYEQLLPYIDVQQLGSSLRKRILQSWPGPTTWALPAHPKTPYWLMGQFSTIAVRIPDHPIVQQLCTAFGQAIISTSANMQGMPPCLSSTAVKEQFGPRIPVIVAGRIGNRAVPSAIWDGMTNRCLRPG